LGEASAPTLLEEPVCCVQVRAQSALIGGAAIQGTSISHVAHLAGALVGVLLVFALTRLPE